MSPHLQGQFVFIRKTGEEEHLFFDPLKLLLSAISNFPNVAISESMLSGARRYSPLYSRAVHRVEKQMLPFSCYLFYIIKFSDLQGQAVYRSDARVCSGRGELRRAPTGNGYGRGYY